MMKVKNKKGITLIALIITVIIMVLLASVVMWQVIADDGIINKILSGTDRYNESKAKEELEINLQEWRIEKYTNKESTLKSFLESKGYVVIEQGEGQYKVVKDNYFFTVDSDLKISDDIVNITTMSVPNVTIDTDGKVTWDEVTGATGYEISFNNSTWETAISGSKTIDVSTTGNKTAYVRAVCTSGNYNTPSESGSKTVTVYSLGLNKGTGIAEVTGAGNYVSGKVVTIGATASEDYTFSTWSVESGNTPVALASAITTITITQNTLLQATGAKNGPSVDSTTGLASRNYTKEFSDDLKITIPEGFGVAQLDDTAYKRVSGVMPADQWDDYLTQENVNDNGVVVVDASGNEFVWVPVKAGTIWWDNDGQRVGQLWAMNTGVNFGTKNTTYTADSGIREPDALKDEDDWKGRLKIALGVDTDEELKAALSLEDLSDGTANANAFKAILQNEFDQMTTSVDDYGGFYVGRYETGGFNTSQCIVKAGEGDNSINRASWYTMYNKTKTLSTANVASTLIWGCQYDAMCNWLNDPSRRKQSYDTRNSYSDLNTGSISSDIDKNIFDLAGNVMEWTMEAKDTDRRVYRGGYYASAGGVSWRSYSYAMNWSETVGGRSALYIK